MAGTCTDMLHPLQGRIAWTRYFKGGGGGGGGGGSVCVVCCVCVCVISGT